MNEEEVIELLEDAWGRHDEMADSELIAIAQQWKDEFPWSAEIAILCADLIFFGRWAANDSGKDARELIERAFTLEPQNPETMCRKAFIHHLDLENQEAELLLRQCLELDPHDEYTISLLADVLTEQRRPAEAIRLIDESGCTSVSIDRSRKDAEEELRNPSDA